MAISGLLLLFSIFIIIVVYFSVRKERDKINYKKIILELALILFGFSLAILWDDIRDYKTDKKERESLVTVLQLELAQIYGALTNNIKTIETNLKVLSEGGRENIGPLVLLDTKAWEGAKLRNNVFIKNTGDLFKFVNLYYAIHIANEKIRFRENYRMANQSMSNYEES